MDTSSFHFCCVGFHPPLGITVANDTPEDQTPVRVHLIFGPWGLILTVFTWGDWMEREAFNWQLRVLWVACMLFKSLGVDCRHARGYWSSCFLTPVLGSQHNYRQKINVRFRHQTNKVSAPATNLRYVNSVSTMFPFQSWLNCTIVSLIELGRQGQKLL